MTSRTIASRKDYSDHDVERGLYALIAFGGSPAPASRALKDAFGLDVNPATLRTWRDATHQQRYTDLQIKHAQDIEDAMVRDTRDLARAAGVIVREAIELTHDKIEKFGHMIRANEAAQIAASMAKVQQTQIDKMLTLTGRPDQITETRSAADIIRALAAKGVQIEPGK